MIEQLRGRVEYLCDVSTVYSNTDKTEMRCLNEATKSHMRDLVDDQMKRNREVH